MVWSIDIVCRYKEWISKTHFNIYVYYFRNRWWNFSCFIFRSVLFVIFAIVIKKNSFLNRMNFILNATVWRTVFIYVLFADLIKEIKLLTCNFQVFIYLKFILFFFLYFVYCKYYLYFYWCWRFILVSLFYYFGN